MADFIPRVVTLKEKAAQAVGRVCRLCGKTPIQYAHARPTKLRGRGRGQHARLRDVVKYPDRYIPLCKECHAIYDRPLFWDARATAILDRNQHIQPSQDQPNPTSDT